MKVKPFLAICFMAFLFSGTALAATTSSDITTLEKSIQKLTVQTAAMQGEIRSLRGEVATLKEQRRQPMARPVVRRTRSTPPRTKRYRRKVQRRPTRRAYHWYSRTTASRAGGNARDYTQGVTVTTSPFLGIRSAFDASDLVINLPTLNEDLRLLKQRKIMERQLGLYDSDFPLRPLIELSGKLEAEAIATRPFTGGTTTDIDLSAAELDTMVEFGPWVTGLLSLSYDNANPVTGARVTNSNIRLDRGFFTIGNLNRSPYYITIGQMFVPFGEYSSQMVTTAMTQSMGRTKERAIVIGASDGGWRAQGYVFKGDAFAGNPGIINNGGGNLGYTWGTPARGGHIGTGVIANLADSEGMQMTSAAGTLFGGFGNRKAAGSEALTHSVPGLDVHFKLTAWQYGLIVEYIKALRPFSAADLSFNGRGAKLQALNVELGHRFTNLSLPLGVAIGYQQTSQALALNLPWRSFLAVISTSFWKNTIEAIEYRHDINYRATDTASGKAALTTSTAGGNRNIVTARMGVYF